MKTVNPSEYRPAVESKTRWGAKAENPGRQVALDAHAARITLHEAQDFAARKACIKRKQCPSCEQGRLICYTRPIKHYTCTVCLKTFQHSEYFPSRKRQAAKSLFKENSDEQS